MGINITSSCTLSLLAPSITLWLLIKSQKAYIRSKRGEQFRELVKITTFFVDKELERNTRPQVRRCWCLLRYEQRSLLRRKLVVYVLTIPGQYGKTNTKTLSKETQRFSRRLGWK